MAITVNGTEYASWDDVPEELRTTLRGALPDADGDGVPDVLQGRATPGRHVVRTMKIKVGDQEYDSPDQLPPELRATLEAAGMVQSAVEAGTRPLSGAQPQLPPAAAGGPVVLNGVPIAPPAKKKHWWQRG
jgi:hypothetical protein